MGIDVHSLNFLRYVARLQKFGAVATIGRQGLHITDGKLGEFFPLKHSYGPFCEQLLVDFFGATKVDSFDFSDYENATYIVDMNFPIDEFCQYDTIIDLGTLEHIYNVPQALKNLSQICCYGGQIIHVLPANNQCGHGFWQFSPELFYSLYSKANGYAETKVFIASLDNETYWYEVKTPSNGERANITSIAPLYVLCRAKKVSNFSHTSVQQSDWVHIWSGKDIPDPEDPRRPRSFFQRIVINYIKRSPFSSMLRVANNEFRSKVSVSVRNPYLLKRSVADLIH